MNFLNTDKLSVLLKNAPSLLLEQDDLEFKDKLSVNKWSKQEILGHLIDSAANNHQRFVRSQFEAVPVIPYDQNEWNKYNYYNEFSKTQLVEFWTVYNTQILQLAQLIPDELLSKECNPGNDEQYTIAYLFNDYVDHLEYHLKQIIAID